MKTAVCVYVRNEELNLLEWIIYNFVVGFDTVIVMDNLSDDATAYVARRCTSVYDVRLESWADTSAHSQRKCYDHVLQAYGAEFDWIAFIDSDEFVVPIAHGKVGPFLSSVGDHAAVGINWAIFGANGHELLPTGLVIEEFTRRAETDFPPNQHIKSIVRPALTNSCAHPHLFHLKGERWDEANRYRSDYVDPSGTLIEWGVQPGLTAGIPDLSICRVHHYFTRSRAHWDRKMSRRWRDVERPYEAFEYHNRNEVLDEAAVAYADEVRNRMSELR